MAKLSGKIGMGNGLFRRMGQRWRKCREFVLGSCEEATDQCCAVIPCSLCLTWSVEGEDDDGGVADWDGDSWNGSVGPVSVVAFWERNYDDACEFVVQANGEEVFRQGKCEESYGNTAGPCRNPSGSAEVTVGYTLGTLSWSALETRELPYTEDEDGCIAHHCGTCDCTCECLCVTISHEDLACSAMGTFCSYHCNYGEESTEVVWQGEIVCGIETYSVKLSLIPNQYTGECEIFPEITGHGITTPLDNRGLTDCIGDLNILWMFDNDKGSVLVQCKQCDVCGLDCVGCCFPEEDGALQSLSWEISDPDAACPGITNATGIFTPIDPTNQAIGACGRCTCYSNISNAAAIPGRFATGIADAFGDCGYSPCEVQLDFRLSCDPNEDLSGGEDCCSRLRLLVRATLSVGGGALNGSEASSNNCGELAEGEWIELSPSACTCSPMTASFSLASLEILCSGTAFASGPCAGEFRCCQINCDLTNVTLEVAVL